ncbi:MAG: hypothetical protein R3344_05165, partial [Acidobacteriota bacterium]|nr:hypothetical protein [Acidobacteriota bacterium]
MRLFAAWLIAMTALMPSLSPAGTMYLAPDVATDLDGPTTFLPWHVVRHVSGGPVYYGQELGLPGNPAIDALHKLDAGGWLLSVEAPNDFAGFLAAAPEDVVQTDGNSVSAFFDGSCVTGAIPAGAGVDAVYLDGADDGDLVVSLDAPATISGTTYMPSALLRYTRTLAGPCGWTLVGQEIDFRDAPTTLWNPAGANVIGADRVRGMWIVALDVPVDLGPSAGPATYMPGQIASFDGVTWDLFEDLPTEGSPGWPVTSQVSALSCQANPGRIDPGVASLLLGKTGAQIEVQCPGSCSSGAEWYGIYEGTLASLRGGVYDHVRVVCDELC